MSTSKELVYITRDEQGEITAIIMQDMKKRAAVVYHVEAQNAEEIAELIGGRVPLAAGK